MKSTAIEAEIEKFRQIVIASSSSIEVMTEAEVCIARLNTLFQKDQNLFSKEDIRYVNSLRGILAQRVTRNQKSSEKFALKGKRRGDEFTHCWRCLTPIDERFVSICAECSDPKGYKFRICPICSACGCQRAHTTLV